MSHNKTVVMARSHPINKILVVDDNQVMLKVLLLGLKRNGYEVFTAVDGPEAFSIVRQENPDLILLDVFFPPDIFESGNTWDAFVIMHWLQRMGGPQAKNIPVFVMSGAEPEEYQGSLSGCRRGELLSKTDQDSRAGGRHSGILPPAHVRCAAGIGGPVLRRAPAPLAGQCFSF